MTAIHCTEIGCDGFYEDGWCNVCGSYELVPLASDHDGGGHELVLGQQSVLHREEARGRAA